MRLYKIPNTNCWINVDQVIALEYDPDTNSTTIETTLGSHTLEDTSPQDLMSVWRVLPGI